ncbi:MAG: hypothetical protein ACJ8ER_01300 [Allosphingosinicella sp.]
MDAEKFERLRRHSLWLSRLIWLLFAATGLVVLLPTAIAVATVAQGQGIAPRILFVFVLWCPASFYLYALWSIGGAFGAFARGGLIGPAMAKGCRRAGVALALGAAASAVAVPNLMRLLAEYGLAVEAVRRFSSVLIFDTAYLAVGVVGIALFLLGGLLESAAAVQQEAQDLRAELGEFF